MLAESVAVLAVLAVLALLKAIYHLGFIVTGVRSGKLLLAAAIGPLALFAPSLFEERVHPHLRRHNFWLVACLVLLAARFLLA